MVKFTGREIASIYDVPPWMVDKDIPRTRKEVLRWKLRWIPRLRRRMLRWFDRLLGMIGLMRISQQMVKEITIHEGRLRLELRNGYRWSGQQDRYGAQRMDLADPPAPPPASYWGSSG